MNSTGRPRQKLIKYPNNATNDSQDEGFAFKTKKSPKKEMNLFEKRNEKEEDEVDVAELRALEKKALESAMATEAPKGAMGDVEEKVEAHKSKSIAHEAPENWKTGKYGPYNTPNPLLVRPSPAD